MFLKKHMSLMTGFCLTGLLLLSGCNTITSSQASSIESTERWALLPIENLSTTPLAGHKAQSLVETHLRSRGVLQLDAYPVPTAQTITELLDDQSALQQAKEWARTRGFRYAVTGTVHEWHYKSGPDKEPAIGLSLKLVDLNSNAVLWQASGARTGWGYSNLTGVADKIVSQLLKKVRLRKGVASASGTAVNSLDTDAANSSY